MKIIKSREYNSVAIMLIADGDKAYINDGELSTPIELSVQTIESEGWIADALLDMYIDDLNSKSSDPEFDILAMILD